VVVRIVLRTDIMFIFLLYCNNNNTLDDLVILHLLLLYEVFY
jgi:hypothetical protein